MSIYGTSTISGSGNIIYDISSSIASSSYPSPDLYKYVCLSQDVSNNVMYNYANSKWDLGLWGPVSTTVPHTSAGFIGTSYSAYTIPKNLVITTESKFNYGSLYLYTLSDTSVTTQFNGTTSYNGSIAFATSSITLPSLKTGFTFSGWWNNKNMVTGHDPSTIFALSTAFGVGQEGGGGNFIQVALLPTTPTTIVITYGLLGVTSSRLDVNISSVVSNPADGVWHFIGVKFYGTRIDLLIDNTWFRNTPSDNNAYVPQNKTMYFTCGYNYGNWYYVYSWIYVSNLYGWSQALTDSYLSQVYTNYAAVYNTMPIITVFAGKYGSGGYRGDGGLATDASLNRSSNMAYDPSGYLYFTEYGNHVIRKIDMSTNIITTFLGNGTSGANFGNGGTAANAKCSIPFGIILDNSKNIFFLDNGTSLRKIDATTTIVTAVLTIPYSYGLCFDLFGNLLAGGASSNIVVIKKDNSGSISSSSQTSSYSTSPYSNYNTIITCDPNGNIWCGVGGGNLAMAKYSATGQFIVQLSSTGPFYSAYNSITTLRPYSGAVLIKPNGNMLYAAYFNSDGYGEIYENTPSVDGQYGFGTNSSSLYFTTKLVVGNSSVGYPTIVQPMSGNYQFLVINNDAYIIQDQNGHCILKIKNYNLL
jgi:hypothetical protein